MTRIYIAWGSTAADTFIPHAHEEPVDMLVSYAYLKSFTRVRDRINVGKLQLDSGAFTAFMSGNPVNFDDFCASYWDVMPDEVFGLDVIGDYRAGIRNLEKMWDRRIPAIPTWHAGEPWDVLEWAKRNSPTGKIAISGSGANRRKDIAKLPDTMSVWLRQAFSRVWPCKVHGFACTGMAKMRLGPFHSVDSTTWSMGPGRFCWFYGYKPGKLGSHVRLLRDMDTPSDKPHSRDYWGEISVYQRRGRYFAAVYKNELALLEELDEKRGGLQWGYRQYDAVVDGKAAS